MLRAPPGSTMRSGTYKPRKVMPPNTSPVSAITVSPNGKMAEAALRPGGLRPIGSLMTCASEPVTERRNLIDCFGGRWQSGSPFSADNKNQRSVMSRSCGYVMSGS